MNFYIIFFIFIIFLSESLECAKILVYNPKYEFFSSHIRFMAQLSDILQENGHQVTVYQPDYDGIIKTSPKKAKAYTRMQKNTIVSDYKAEQDFVKRRWEEAADDLKVISKATKFIENTFISSCKYQIEDYEALKYLKEENFDLGIAESSDNCGFGIFHAIGLNKTITVFTLPFPDNLPPKLGLARGESFIPTIIGGNEVEMNFWGRLQNLYRLWHLDSTKIYGNECGIEKIIQDKIDPKYTSANAIAQSSLIFVNSEEHLDFPRPITPKIVYIGGFNLDLKDEENDDELENFVNDTKDGFIYISFGSIAQSALMPKEIKNAFLETFKRFPNINFLWKYENSSESIAAGLPNVITKEWFNQPAILDHPKLIAFITHGGMNSLIELSYKGVPAISIPLFADQYRNAHLLKYRKTGIILFKNEITAENLEAKINQIINDKSFKENALKLSKMMNSKPFSAKEKFLRHVKFAANNGNFDNFNLHGKNLNVIEYYNLDIYGLVLAVLFVFVFVFVKAIISVYKVLRKAYFTKVKNY